MRTREEEWLLREKYGGVESDEFRADAKRLAQGEPVDYVIGFSTFLGCRIGLSHRPLIPRTETEYWVEKAIAEVKKKFGEDKAIRCLDVFSGSGCIGIAVLSRLPSAVMDFADIDPLAIRQIQENAEMNSVDPKRFSIYLSDVFDSLPVDKKYDVIFANPPYIGESDMDRVAESVLAHEPHHALFSGSDGLRLIERTLEQAIGRLNPGSFLFLECDDFQKEKIENLLVQYPALDHVFEKDQFGAWRWVRIWLRA